MKRKKKGQEQSRAEQRCDRCHIQIFRDRDRGRDRLRYCGTRKGVMKLQVLIRSGRTMASDRGTYTPSEYDQFQRIFDLEQELREVTACCVVTVADVSLFGSLRMREREKSTPSTGEHRGATCLHSFRCPNDELEDTESDGDGDAKYFSKKQTRRVATGGREEPSRDNAEQRKNVRFDDEKFAWNGQHNTMSSYERHLEIRKKVEASMQLARAKRQEASNETEETKKAVQRWSLRQQASPTSDREEDASSKAGAHSARRECQETSEGLEEQRGRELEDEQDCVGGMRHDSRRQGGAEEGERKQNGSMTRANGWEVTFKSNLGRDERNPNIRGGAGAGAGEVLVACLLEEDNLDAPRMWTMKEEVKVHCAKSLPRPLVAEQVKRTEEKEKEKMSLGDRVKIIDLRKNVQYNGW
eukprot:746030-Hanusia_phi.AAC.5